MKKINKKYILLILLASLLIMTSCQKNISKSTQKKEIKLYYNSMGKYKLDWINRSVEYNDEKMKYEVVLNELINGPYSSYSERSINEQTKVNSIEKKHKNLKIDLSKEFLKTNNDCYKDIAVMSIVNTMSQFKEIESIDITIDGKPLVDENGKTSKNLSEYSTKNLKTVVKFYYPDSEYIKLEPKASKTELVVGEWIGANIIESMIDYSYTQKESLFPKNLKLLNYKEENGIAIVDFNDKIEEGFKGGTSRETMILYSIVNTITELNHVNSVLFLINGEKQEFLDQFEIDQPISKDLTLVHYKK